MEYIEQTKRLLESGKLTKREKKELLETLEALEIKKAQNDYYSYVKFVHGSMYKQTTHAEYICNVIDRAIKNREKMLSGEIKSENQYIMLSIPPRHGKSMNVTETLPSYFLGKFPNERVIMVSYGDDLVVDFSRKNRDKVSEYGKSLFNIELDPSTRSASDWNIKGTRGGAIARGIMAGITGKGGALIILDDVIKNAEEANSESHRERIWQEWLGSIKSRFEPPAIYIIIMTRWHEDDLVGRLLNKEYGQPLPWLNLVLPLEAEENDLLGRKIGEPLWEEKYGYDFIEETKQYPSLFNSLYQGRPTSQKGNILKRDWWKFYSILPKMQYKVISVDASFKDGKKNDFVAIQCWGKSGSDMYLIDRKKARMDFPTTLQAIKNMINTHKDYTCILIEDKANGSAIISMLKKEVSGVIPVNPEGGKEARVHAISPHIESGNTYLPTKEIMPEISDFIEECASFPKGKHDDDVDSMSQALTRLVYFYSQNSTCVKPPGDFYTDEEMKDLGYKNNQVKRPGKVVKRRCIA